MFLCAIRRPEGLITAFAAIALKKPRTTVSGRGLRAGFLHDVIVFSGENYNRVYAENSRETFRKQAMHPFRTADFIQN